jgi:eukaryotic-like serine/threonine-protein kinase
MEPAHKLGRPDLNETLLDGEAQAPSVKSCAITEIGDYEILEELGRGGMGIVLKARQRSLNRVVAIKMILGQAFANDKSRQRFRREAELIAALNHPNIVDIYEIGEFEGQPFYSMEYIEGTTLKELVQGTPLGWTQAVRFALVIAQAMQFAHERGVIHRDLKPHNVMVDRYQGVHVTDFGTARDLNADSGLTIAGSALGTPNYMSPEQCVSDATISAAADIYSMGAIIYEMVTSIPPFMGSNVHDLLDKVRNAAPLEPRLINPSIPRDLNTICLKCLQKDPARRYQTSGELAEELDRVLKDLPIKAKPVSKLEKGWRWCRRNRLLASVIAGSTIAIIAAAIVAMIQAHYTRVALDETEIHREAAVAINLLESSPPQGLRLAFTAMDDCIRKFGAPFSDVEESLSAALNRSTEMISVDPHYAKLDSAVICGDGRSVVMAGDGLMTLFDLETGKEISHFQGNPAGRTTAIATDAKGDVVASAGRDGTVRWWNSTGQLLGQLPRQTQGWITAMALSPDGQKIATAGADRRPHLWDIHGNELPFVAGEQHNSPITQLIFRPDGKVIASADLGSACTIQMRNLDGTPACPTISPRNAGTSALAFSPDGRTLAVGGLDACMRFWNAQGQANPDIENLGGRALALAYRPDGTGMVTASAPQLTDSLSSGIIAFYPSKSDGETIRGDHVRAVAFGPGETVAMADDHGCRVYNKRPLCTSGYFPLPHAGSTNGLAILSDGKTLVTSISHDTIGFFDFSGTRAGPDLKLADTGGNYPHIQFSREDGILAAFNKGSFQVKFWKLEAGKWNDLFILDNQAPVYGFAFSTASNRIVTGMSHEIWIRDMAGRSIAKTSVDARSLVGQIVFSPDGKLFAAANIPNAIPIFDSDGHPAGHIDTEGLGDVSVMAISPDGELLAAGFATGFVAIYDLKTFQPVTPPLGLGRNQINPSILAFSPDSGRIVSSGISHDGGVIQLWDIKGNPLTPPVTQLARQESGVGELCFSPDGKLFLTRYDRGAEFWAGNWQSLMDLAAQRLRHHPVIQTSEPEAIKAREIIARRIKEGAP